MVHNKTNRFGLENQVKINVFISYFNMLKLLFTEDSRKKCEITFKGLLKAVILYKKKNAFKP